MLSTMEKPPGIIITKRVTWVEDDKISLEAKTPITPALSTSNDKKTTAGWKSLFAFTRKQHLLPLSVALFTAISAGATGPALTIFVGKLFDTFAQYASGKLDHDTFERKLSQQAIYLAVLGLVSFLLGGGSYVGWVTFGETQARTCRSAIFDGLLEKPMSWYDTRRSGSKALVARLNTQVRELQAALSQPCFAIFHGVVTIIASLGVSFYYCWSLTLVILASTPISVLILNLLSSKMQPFIASQVELMEKASKQTIGAVNAIETVKLFGGETIELHRYLAPLRAAAGYYHNQIRINALTTGFGSFVTYSVFVQGFWYGNHLVANGKVSAGTVVTTFFSALTAMQTISAILPQFIFMQKGIAAGAALNALVDTCKPEADAITAVTPTSCRGEIEFRNVSFAYPIRPSHVVLKNISCSFAAGSTVFLIGQSGSGKSTLAQLLINLYEPDEGEIALDGQSLSTIDKHWLRSNITLVEQYSTLFNGTISNNIALGNAQPSSVSLADVKLAAEFALLQQTFNDLPDGFDTMLASDNSLSGGQRQRMAIARARLRDTPVAFFDESTSALDQTSRSLIMAAIRHWRKGKTTIFISHDVSQIEKEDFVYVFEDGRLADQGYRQELELLSPNFAKYFQPLDSSVSEVNEAVKHMSMHEQKSASPRASSSWYDAVNTEEEYEATPVENKRKTRFSKMFNMQAPPRDAFLPFTMRSPLMSPTSFERPSLTKTATSSQSSTRLRHSTKEEITQNYFTNRRSQRMSLQLLENLGEMAKQLRYTPAARARRRLQVLPGPRSDIEATGADSYKHEVLTLGTILSTIWPTLDLKLRVCLVIGFTATAVHAGTTPAFSYIFSKLFVQMYTPSTSSAATRKSLLYSLAILAIGLVDGLAVFTQRICFERCGQTWVDSFRIEALQHILAQPRAFFLEDGNSPGEIAQALDRYAEEMRNLLGRFSAIAFTAVIMIAVSTVWSFITCWKLTLVGLSLTPATFLLGWLFTKVAAIMEAKSNDAAEVAGAILSETCTNIRTVRTLTLEEYFRNKFEKAAKLVVKIGVRKALYAGFFFGVSDSTHDFGTAVLFYYGGKLVASGDATIEQVQTVFSMLLFAIVNIGQMIEFIPQVSSSRDTASRLIYLARLPMITHEDEGSVRPTSIGDIAFRNVTFAYESRPEQPALCNVDLRFPAGSITALVGFSGSGKSTIASLLLRLYPFDMPTSLLAPTTTKPSLSSGSITVSRRQLNHIHTSTLRSLISIVSQTPTLFPATITENICYGLPVISPLRSTASLHAAATAAGIHDLIMSLPHGYSTSVGDGGFTLSGGQTQRICIARALIRRPSVLILDEATSALDSASAKGIRDTIMALKNDGSRRAKNLTVIVITHSVEMMRGCKRVVMMEKGCVVEEGGWTELIGGRGEKGRRLREMIGGGVWERGRL